MFNHLPVQQTKHLGDLPVDVQFAILQLCEPSDLADISRVHSSLKGVAECALYSHIRFCVPPLDISLIPDDNSVPSESNESFLLLLRTFSGNPQKASMVKKLYVKLETYRMYKIESKAISYLLVKLADALEKMANLVDLRVIYNLGIDLSEGRISEVIRFVFKSILIQTYETLYRILAGGVTSPFIRFTWSSRTTLKGSSPINPRYASLHFTIVSSIQLGISDSGRKLKHSIKTQLAVAQCRQYLELTAFSTFHR